MTMDKDRWARVLSAVEAEARHAEALLEALNSEQAEEVAEHGLAVPTSWLLPSSTATAHEPVDPFTAFMSREPVELPALDQMPEVPEELGERITQLQARIAQLQGELAEAIRDWQPAPRRTSFPQASRPPVYVDRQL